MHKEQPDWSLQDEKLGSMEKRNLDSPVSMEQYQELYMTLSNRLFIWYFIFFTCILSISFFGLLFTIHMNVSHANQWFINIVVPEKI